MNELKTRRDMHLEVQSALAGILACPVEDLELVWQALSPAERSRLRPLLLQTSQDDGTPPPFLDMLTTETPDEVHDRASMRGEASKVAAAIETLPDDLATRLFNAVDTTLQSLVLDALSECRRNLVRRQTQSGDVTHRANAAWLKACLEYSVENRPDRSARPPGASARVFPNAHCARCATGWEVPDGECNQGTARAGRYPFRRSNWPACILAGSGVTRMVRSTCDA